MISRSALGALLIDHLSARGCPVVSPADPNVPTTFERSAEFGRLLARFHNATEDFVPTTGSAWTDLSPRNLMGDDPGWIERTYAHDIDSCKTLVQWWRVASSLLAMDDESDSGMCHGEAYPATCRVAEGGLALAELDWAGEGPRVYDLATYRWAVTLHAGGEGDALFAQYLEGYSAVREPPDLARLRAWVAARHLWSLRLVAGFAEPDELTERAAFAHRWEIA